MIELLSTIYSIENLSAYTMLELVTKIINKLDEAIEELNEDTDAISEIQEDILELQGIVETLSTNLNKLAQDVDALKGVGGYLKPYDFETATPTEAQLNAYALSQITNISTPEEIWNGTRVTNLYNNHTWILNNTQNTDPVVFEWVDLGQSLVSIANNTTLGVVKGSTTNLKIAVDANGEMSVNGLNDALAAKMENPMTSIASIIYGGPSGDPMALTAGNAGDVLTMNATGTSPEWKAPSGGQLYRHTIKEYNSPIITIYSTSNTPINTSTQLAQLLLDLGYDRNDRIYVKGYQTRLIMNNNEIRDYLGLYATEYLTIYELVRITTITTDGTNISIAVTTTSSTKSYSGLTDTITAV